MSRLPDGDYALTEFRTWTSGRRPAAALEASDRGEQGTQGHNGSVRAITDSSGAVVAHYEYDAWGNQLASSSPFSGGFAYGFCGSWGVRTDETTGLVWMRHRWFSAGLGRFLSRDPARNFRNGNRYLYAADRPVDRFDPLGLEPIWESTGTEGIVNDFWNWMIGEQVQPNFGPETQAVEDLKTSPGVQEARMGFIQKNSAYRRPFLQRGEEPWPPYESYTDHGFSFDAGDFLEASWPFNLRKHYLGSYTVDIYPQKCGEYVKFVVTDSKSTTSFFYHLVPEMPGPFPMGTQTQTYEWYEPTPYMPQLYTK